MLKRIISAAMAIIMVTAVTAFFPLDVSAGTVKTDTATGKFYCTFVNNDYDSNVKTLRGVAADSTWGGQFPIVNEIIEKKVSFDTVKSVIITVRASNTQPCDKGVSPKLELHWNSRDNNDGSTTVDFVNGSATVSGTLPAGTSRIVLNPYAFNASVGEITFDVSIEFTYEEPTVEPESGYIGYPNATDVSWVLSEDGTLTLSGKGNIRALNKYDWYFSDKPIRKIVIEEGITAIGSYVFQKCDKLKSVEIASSVTTIGSGAFDSCWELVSVKMPENLTRLNKEAFRFCNKLEEITLPESLTFIGSNCFEKCIVLESVNIPGKVTSIGDAAFSQCAALKSVTIGEGLTAIGNNAFYFCDRLESISLPSTLKKIGNNAFSGCQQLRISALPENVTSIGSYAFNYCTRITELELPESVKTIGDRAFQSCENLRKLTISSSETTLGKDVTIYSDKVTVYGNGGSPAHEWAKANNVPFVFIPVAGDVDGDGYFTTTDVDLVIEHITGVSQLSGEMLQRADVDGSGIIDIRDCNLIFAKIK